jgi:hypothetical protein
MKRKERSEKHNRASAPAARNAQTPKTFGQTQCSRSHAPSVYCALSRGRFLGAGRLSVAPSKESYIEVSTEYESRKLTARKPSVLLPYDRMGKERTTRSFSTVVASKSSIVFRRWCAGPLTHNPACCAHHCGAIQHLAGTPIASHSGPETLRS